MNITNFDLEKWYVKYEFSSKYNLSASGIKPCLSDNFNIQTSSLGYLPAQGSLELLSVLAKKNETDISNILITNGAIEALFLIQLSLLSKGDKIIVQKPCYPALYQIASDLGVEIYDWELIFENSFKPDLDKLENLVKKIKPKMLIINSPNNPTGVVLNDTEKETIDKLSEKHNFYLLSDEVYDELNFKEKNNYKFKSKKKIIVSSLSKAYGLPGLRIGWMLADKDIIQKCMNLRHYTSLCSNVFGETIAVKVLNESENYLSQTNEFVQKNYQITKKFLDELKQKELIDFVEPKGGLTFFIKLNSEKNIEEFCEEFENEYSILLLPGNKYEKKYDRFFRLGFGMDSEDLIHCLIQLKQFLLAKQKT